MTEVIQNETFNEVLRNYYQLKKDYQNDYNKAKNNILQNKETSWKEKRRLLQKIKRKCINCKQDCGTNFLTKIDDKRHMFALCNARDKCPLNIHLETGFTFNIEDELNLERKLLSEYKLDIIKNKNSQIFGYDLNNDIILKFKFLQDKYEEVNKSIKDLLINYLLIIDNKIDKTNLKIKEEAFYKFVESFKNIIKEYEITGNIQIINEGVKNYVEDLIPLNKEIADNKYSYQDIEYDQQDKLYRLIQIFKTIEELEISTSDNKIISNITGMPKKKNKKNITLRSYKDSNNKTKKIRSEEVEDTEENYDDDDDDNKNEEDNEDESNIIIKQDSYPQSLTIEEDIRDDESLEDEELKKNEGILDNSDGSDKYEVYLVDDDNEDNEDEDKDEDEYSEDSHYDFKPKIKIDNIDIETDSLDNSIPLPPPLNSSD